MYTEDEEMTLFHERFNCQAFYSVKGKPVLQIKIPLNSDLAWCKIIKHDYDFQWWKDFVGIIFLAKLIFHHQKGTEGDIFYLFEVLPVQVNNSGYALHGKSISADYIFVLDAAEYVAIKG